MVVRRRKPIVVIAVTVVASMTLMLTACTSDEPATARGGNAGPDGTPVAYQEPVKLSSENGVLEVRLSAHQGTVDLDTVSEPVSGFLVFGYEVLRGTSSDGSTTGDDVYPAPTLRVDPGDAGVLSAEVCHCLTKSLLACLAEPVPRYSRDHDEPPKA